ncbi:MAG: amidohydrolase family protein [Spongiibacteraceae bacterium]
MSTDFDIVIRGGLIVDGTGSTPHIGDVAVSGNKIVAIGNFTGSGHKEINAHGMTVTPGFVDIHTHYDGQITWENRLTPSSNHGVTTVVMGNCGVGFAPTRRDPDSHQLVIKLMEGVEDIPEVVMSAGVPWNWETFPDYLDALSQRTADIDFAALLPHSPLRVYVMGERGANMEPPTAADLSTMRQLVADAVRAGAFGVSTSRNLAHRFRDGKPAPSVLTEQDELLALAQGLADAGAGLFQLIPCTDNPATDEFALIRQLAETSGRPVTFSLITAGKSAGSNSDAVWYEYVTGLETAHADGLPITGQIHPKPIGVLMGLNASYHPFSLNPSYRPIAHLPLKEKVAALKNPELRAKLLAEEPNDPNPLFSWLVKQSDHLFVLGNPPTYIPDPATSIKARASALGRDYRELIYDELLNDEGHALLISLGIDGMHQSYDNALDLFGKPGIIVGLGDGGAHYGMICDASYTTFMLIHFCRDAEPTRRMSIERVVKMLSRETAQTFGLHDRGVLAPGYKADINIIDMNALTMKAPRMVFDLPVSGGRLSQASKGYQYTIVSGEITYQDGRATQALPGRLVRGMQSAPH